MAFQHFKYRVQDIIGYVEYLRIDEKYDMSHNVHVSKDEFGHIIAIETQISYREDNKDYISKGKIYYFIPIDDNQEDYFNLKFIVTELSYQAYMRQAGHIYSKYSIIVSTMPNVYQLYNEFQTTYNKNHF